MLKTNQVLFFDAQEFEGIVQYYIDYGELKSGIAVSDESQVFAFGLATITTNNLIDYIENYNIKNNITNNINNTNNNVSNEE